MDHTFHANNAVHDAVVSISARLGKRVRVNEALVGRGSRKAVRIVRGAILRIGHARRTAGDTVSALGPSPLHSVAHRDVDCVRHKHIAALSHRHVDSRARRRSDAAHGRLAVLIENAQRWRALSVGRVCAFFPRFSPHQKAYRQDGCDPEN